MSAEHNQLHEPVPQPPSADTGRTDTQTPVAVAPSYAWIFWVGLFLVLLLFGLFYFFGSDFLEKKAAESEVKPIELQAGILLGLQSEIDTYKAALSGDVCATDILPSLFDRLAAPFGVQPPPPSGALPLSPSGALPEATTLPEMVEQATVMVLADSPGSVATGTAFFIAQGLLLTNSHVVEDVITDGGQVYVTSKALGGMVEAEVTSYSKFNSLRDYALLTVDLPLGRSPPPLPLTSGAQRTQRVSSWGYPTLLTQNDQNLTALMEGDLSATPEVVYSEGVISVIQDQGGLSIISHTAEVSSGNSGGPLVNERGQVVGINTMIQVDDKSSRQVNIALSSDDILAFISEQGLALPQKKTGQ